MFNFRKQFQVLMLSLPFTLFGFVSVTQAQDGESAEAESSEGVLEEVITLGTRSKGRSVKDSTAPIDVISGSAFENQSSNDINNILRNLVPSYNVSAQPISDASTFVRPASLRGLASDHTLVLLNGKRRHRSAVINFYTAGDSTGAQGADVSVFPSIALKAVEVLRDGAAAQYGSDAIAGVINFQLKDASDGGSLEVKAGSTYSGDGDNFQIAGNKGFELGSNGFLNLSFTYGESDPTDRSVQVDSAAALEAAGVSGVPNPAQIWGTPRVHNDLKSVINMGADISDNMQFYAFGNYAKKEATNGLYYRPSSSRGGVFTTGSNVLIADLDGVGVGASCPTVAANDLAGIASLSSNPNCFSFHELFPGGFTPSMTGTVTDLSLVGGFRGEFNNGLTYDVSVSGGSNEAAFVVDSINASFGPDTKLIMDAGKYTQTDQNINADFTYPLSVESLADDLMVAFGFEYRDEEFSADSGHPHSYEIGSFGAQGFQGGSQGYVGLSSAANGSWSRSNIAAYVDLEADVTDSLLVTGALRWEDFDDFGSTVNSKISTRWDLTDTVSLRGSYATGFRAPTPGQQNIKNVSSLLNAGVISLSGIVPSTDPLAVSVGGQQLKPEESTSFSIGAIMALGGVDLTVDYFDVTVDDRISLSPFFDVTSPEFTSLRYYTNDFETNTKGIDVVATYLVDMGEGVTSFALAGNWTKTKIKRHNNLDSLRIRTIEDGMPSVRGNFTINHQADKWRVLARANYFGSYYNGHISFTDMEPSAEVTIDLEVAYDIAKNMELIAGVNNLFNTFPDEVPDEGLPMNLGLNGTDALFDTKGNWGSKYPEFSPMGINGGTFYIRYRYIFD